MVFIKLVIDMDEVICDFLGELCVRYNLHTGATLSVEQLNQYDLTPFIGEVGKQLFLRPGFFSELKPFPQALKILKKLHLEGNQIIVATDAKGSIEVASDKKKWVERHIPFLAHENFIVTAEKHFIDADLIFDDSPEVLNKFPGIKVVMDRPYNKEVDAYRIYNNDWLQFYSLVKDIEARKFGSAIAAKEYDWQAIKQWRAISIDDRERITRTAYCTSCRGITTVIEFIITLVGGSILLSGICKKCGAPVNRIVERE